MSNVMVDFVETWKYLGGKFNKNLNCSDRVNSVRVDVQVLHK